MLCVDEKSQIQALDRTQPGLPLKKGRCGTMTHDYKRHGTTTLFAALQVLDGKVIGQCFPRHTNREFLRFLRRLDREFSRNLTLHLILDNYGTHTHPNVKAWLATHPRFVLHFTPTSASWLNLVERWFRELTTKRIRRGVFHSVNDLVVAIDAYLHETNTHPKPSSGPRRSTPFLLRLLVVKLFLRHYTSIGSVRRTEVLILGVVGSRVLVGTDDCAELDYEGPPRGARRQNAVVQDQVDARPRRERRKALQQLDRLGQELRRPVRPGAPQGELDLAVVGEFEAVVRHGRPQMHSA